MTDLDRTGPRRVAVVGGGVLGVSAAQQLARAGAAVVLVTEADLVSQASGRSLSWLNSAGARSERYSRLRMAGIDRYRTVLAQHPEIGWLRFDGGLSWSADAAELRRRHEHEVAHGYDSHLVTADQVAAQVPGVDPAAVSPGGAVWNPGEGWVDLPSLVRFLAEDLVAHGGHVRSHAGPCQVVTDADGVTGVRTGTGDTVPADAVLLATGAAVPAMVAELGVSLPDASPVSLLVATRPVAHRLRAVLNTPRVSLRPRPDGSLAVDADWTAAALTRTDDSYAAPPETVVELLAEASAVLAGHPPLTADWSGAGPKPIPADGEPVLGRIDEVPGLHVAFTHSGATLGLIAGELLAYEILRDTEHPMLEAFRARRFRPR